MPGTVRYTPKERADCSRTALPLGNNPLANFRTIRRFQFSRMPLSRSGRAFPFENHSYYNTFPPLLQAVSGRKRRFQAVPNRLRRKSGSFSSAVPSRHLFLIQHINCSKNGTFFRFYDPILHPSLADSPFFCHNYNRKKDSTWRLQ